MESWSQDAEAVAGQGSGVFGKQSQCQVRQGTRGAEVGQACPLRYASGEASCSRPMYAGLRISFLNGPSWLESSFHGWNKI